MPQKILSRAAHYFVPKQDHDNLKAFKYCNYFDIYDNPSPLNIIWRVRYASFGCTLPTTAVQDSWGPPFRMVFHSSDTIIAHILHSSESSTVVKSYFNKQFDRQHFQAKQLAEQSHEKEHVRFYVGCLPTSFFSVGNICCNL